MSHREQQKMPQLIAALRLEKERFDKLPPFKKAEAAERMFAIMVEILESFEQRIALLE